MESTKNVTKATPRYNTLVHFEIPRQRTIKDSPILRTTLRLEIHQDGRREHGLLAHQPQRRKVTVRDTRRKQGMSQQGILNYFSVKSIDESLKQASSLGATIVMSKQETGRGHFAILTDPNGNTFALFQG